MVHGKCGIVKAEPIGDEIGAGLRQFSPRLPGAGGDDGGGLGEVPVGGDTGHGLAVEIPASWFQLGVDENLRTVSPHVERGARLSLGADEAGRLPAVFIHGEVLPAGQRNVARGKAYCGYGQRDREYGQHRARACGSKTTGGHDHQRGQDEEEIAGKESPAQNHSCVSDGEPADYFPAMRPAFAPPQNTAQQQSGVKSQPVQGAHDSIAYRVCDCGAGGVQRRPAPYLIEKRGPRAADAQPGSTHGTGQKKSGDEARDCRPQQYRAGGQN